MNWESLIASRNREIVSCRIADPVKRRAYRSKLAYYKTEKGKESRKEADARFREKHREQRNEYSRNYYAQHREYYAQYRLKLKQKKGGGYALRNEKTDKENKAHEEEITNLIAGKSG